MKTKIILPLIAIIFLSSCADKFSLTKRKYTKGYYFASSKTNSSAKNQSEHKNLLEKNLPAQNSNLVIEPISNNEIIATTNNSPIIVSNTLEKKTTLNSERSNITASANSKTSFAPKAAIKPLLEKQIDKTNTSKNGKSDETLIIMVILCLFPFINLIPVYLHDGKSLTLNFWVTLILDCLFFLPGIIFALLVVLDVFSIA